MDKKKLFTIGEFSKVTGVSIHSLRYYDEIGALTPEYVDPLSNYRYYSFAQLSRLFAINICINSGIRLNELDCFISNDSVDYGRLLEGSRNSIDSRIDEFLAHKTSLERIEKMLSIRSTVMNSSETVVRLDDFTVWAIPHTVKSGRNGGSSFVSDSDLIVRLSAQARKSRVQISPMCFGLIRINNAEIYEFALLAEGAAARADDMSDDPHLIRIPEGDYMVRKISGIQPEFEEPQKYEASEVPHISISCAAICDDHSGNMYFSIDSI